MEDLVSIVVPIYEVVQYLRECLDSIVNQTYKNLEIILVDDGSTDGSAEICDEYAEKDDRIVVIHKANGGLVSARKTGVERCTGEYTAYVDGDDWIDVNYIERFTSINISKEVDIMVFNYIREGKERLIGEILLEDGYYRRRELEFSIFPRMLYSEGFYRFGISQYPHKIFKTELLKKFQYMVPDNISLGEDVALTYPMLLECSCVYICNQPAYHYRFNEDGISIRYRERTASDSKILIDYLRRTLPDKYGLARQIDYYLCLMVLTNVVNTARGGLFKGFKRRMENLLKFIEDTDFESCIKKCKFRSIDMSLSKRIGVILLELKMYRMAVFIYAVKNTIVRAG